ncbi:MAG: alpha/beta hydrolase [Actinomycetota bacterium]
MSLPRLSGPSAAPASGGPARQLVVMLHGVGSDGQDLIDLAPFVAEALPDAAFVAPNAPFAFDMATGGHQWFSLQVRSSDAIIGGVRQAAPILDAYLDEMLAEHGLGEDALALVGFSQGAMMALHVALRRTKPVAAVVAYSGALPDPEVLPAEITARPRVLLVHGEEDQVVNPLCLPLAERTLASVGVPVMAEMRKGLGHGIDGHGARLGREFLRQALDPTP